jgi:hypothetical protein
MLKLSDKKNIPHNVTVWQLMQCSYLDEADVVVFLLYKIELGNRNGGGGVFLV